MAQITKAQAWDRFTTAIERSLSRFGALDRSELAKTVHERAKRSGYIISKK